MAHPKFTVIQQSDGGTLLSMNKQCCKLILEALEAREAAQPAETGRDKKTRQALIRELKQPSAVVVDPVAVSVREQKRG